MKGKLIVDENWGATNVYSGFFMIFVIIVSFMLFTVFTLIYVLYFGEFLIHESAGQ